jgi:hypothetical protein
MSTGAKLSCAALSLLALYGLVAYVLLPFFWKHYEHNPSLAAYDMVARTRAGLPGDPLNVGLLGTPAELTRALAVAGWTTADSLTPGTVLKTSLETIIDRPYPHEPVSGLYWLGRRQDLAFEQVIDGRTRHHVRFWRTPYSDAAGRPLWLGAATYDRRVGFSHYTGGLTHHIAPDIDAERDRLIVDLKRARQLQRTYQVTGVGPTISGRNGGGDWYYTDGELTVGLLMENNARRAEEPEIMPNPIPVRTKLALWPLVRRIMQWIE